MSTRGAVGFRINGQDKITYNHSDSYPSGLGDEVLDFIKKHTLESIKNSAEQIVVVDGNSTPTEEQIAECIQYANTSVSTGKLTEWYVLLRGSQGDLDAYIKGLKYMINKEAFLLDSLFCEYAYIINLDTSKLEFYLGFNQKNDPDKGRYAWITKDSDKDEPYYGVTLEAEFDLNQIKVSDSNSIWLESMESISNEDEEE